MLRAIRNNESSILKRAEKAFVRQQDQSDCGIACLASIINIFGGEFKLERLRELSGTGKQGTTLLGLYQAAIKKGLQAEAYEATLDNLKKQIYPCILHVIKDNHVQHYVIYYGLENGKCIISDPAEGVKLYEPRELDKLWQSKALLLLKPTEKLVTVREKRKYRWEWIQQLVKDDLNILSLALALGIFVSFLSLVTAIFTQKLIDDILPNRDTLKLLLGLGLLGFLLLARSGLMYLRQLFLITQSRDFNNRIIDAFYGSLLKLPVPFFFNRKTGDLIARMNDTQRLQQTVTYLFSQVMIDILLILVAGIFIIYHSIFLGLFVLLSVPTFLLLTWYYNKPILKGQKEVMVAHSLNESHYIDTIQGIAAIKAGNRESFFSELTRKVYGFYQGKVFDLGKVGIGFGFWADVVGLLFIIGVLTFSSMMVLQGELLIGVLVAIFQMTGQLIPSANRLALTNIQLQEARVAFDRMYEFTSLEPEYSLEEEKTKEEIIGIDELSVSELSFRFPGRSQLLKDISFTVQKGEMIALMGESGSGKTTVLQILQRFHKPESGRIKVNRNQNWDDLSFQSWRDQLAVVPQNIKIFNGTLLDNICLGDAQEEAHKVVAFCKEYGFSKYFESFPQQYGTLLGEEGVNISGGQCQLVTLARALYQKPDLLLLDEATSAMDRKTEQEMLRLLFSLKDELAIILVTHRIQSAKLADRMYIIEEGKVTHSGTAEELLMSDNFFSKSLADISV